MQLDVRNAVHRHLEVFLSNVQKEQKDMLLYFALLHLVKEKSYQFQGIEQDILDVLFLLFRLQSRRFVSKKKREDVRQCYPALLESRRTIPSL